MLFFIVGKDRFRVQQKVHERIKNTHTQIYEALDMSISQIQEMMNVQSLFGEVYTYLMQDVHENEQIENQIFSQIELLQSSENTFICTIARLLKKQKESIEKYKVIVDEVVTTTKKEMPSFVLADAFLARDKKRAWVAVCEELKTKSPEEVHGGLWYNIKSLLLVQSGATQIESGLHPFVYAKIKKVEKLFEREILTLLAQELFHIPQRAHRGKSDFATALEQWVLKWTM